MNLRPRVLTLAIAALAAACGVDASRVPTAPPVSAPPPVTSPPEGTWTGTLVVSNWPYSPLPITAKLVRAGGTLTGTWDETVWLELGGEIKGTLDDTSFVGTVSVNSCSGTSRGTLTATAGELTSVGMTDCGSIFPGVPTQVDIKLVLSRWYAGPG